MFFMLAPPSEHIVRPQLLESLREADQPLVLVVALASYGKATLMTDWVRTDRHTCAWLSLNSADNEPTHFWMAVVTTLAPVASPACLSRLPRNRCHWWNR